MNPVTPDQRKFCQDNPWFRDLHRLIVDAGIGIGPYKGKPVSTICEANKVPVSTYYKARATWTELSIYSARGVTHQAAMIKLHHMVGKVVPGKGSFGFNAEGESLSPVGECHTYTWAGLVAHVAMAMQSEDSKMFLACLAQATKAARAVKSAREGRVTTVQARRIIAEAMRIR